MKKRKSSKKSGKKGKKGNYGVLIAFLSILSLAGIGYIAYDLFFKDFFKKGGIKFQNLKVTNSFDKEDFESGESFSPQVYETNIIDNQSEDVATNYEGVKREMRNVITNIRTNMMEGKAESKFVIKKLRIFLYREVGDNISFYYELVELTNVQDPVMTIFSKLKSVKSEGNRLSFVNPKVRLIDYKITPEKTLVINLSKDVNYNSYGSEGVLYSIYQIAYTLGIAAGCKDVLVLIEGEEPEYLGGEGIMFDNPINISRPPKINF